jgi:hypothetical protein
LILYNATVLHWLLLLTVRLIFSTATVANANQGGLFDMMGDDAHGSSTQEPEIGGHAALGCERTTHQ